MSTDSKREALLRIMRANWHYGYEGMADGILAAGWTPPSRASVAQQVGDVREAANGLEAAAQWHDMRRRQTPDAFEMEFHEASAAAIRALPAPEVTDAMVERGAKLLDAHLDLSPGQLRGLARAVLLDALQPGEGSR